MTLADETRLRREADKKLQDQINALAGRLDKLEQAAIPVPVPTPVPTPTPTPVPTPTPTPTPTPGRRPIYGFGAQVTGGASGPTRHVTTTASTGSGSLAAAFAAGSGTIVFDVGGTFALPNDLDFRGSGMTIDGSTAPAPGVTIKDYDLRFQGGARNIILRDFRHRGVLTTTDQEGHCLHLIHDVAGVLAQNLSLSGFNDEALTGWDRVRDVTVQDVLLGPGKNSAHNFPFIISSDTPATRCERWTVHHNLIYGGRYRNPLLGAGGQIPADVTADVVNNVVWDWIDSGIYAYWGAKANIEGNYLSGPQDPITVESDSIAYLAGNVWKQGTVRAVVSSSRFPLPYTRTVETASDALRSVVDKVGCRVGGLDAYDQAIIAKIKTAAGL